MKAWIEPEDISVPTNLLGEIGGHPLVAETLYRRGISDIQTIRGFLYPQHYSPASPFDLPNMLRAVERVEYAIQHQEKIGVWGDFDVDGQTATSLLVSALTALGAQNISYYIPNRQTEGHGIHIPKLQTIIDEGAHLIITCDTGIAAHEAVNYSRERGVAVIVTDHHNLPPELPKAYANVNPKLLPETHPLRELPGVGCAYKLIEALFIRAGRENELANYLDLVALGIVADVAVQQHDTRYLLQKGLETLRRNQRLGLQVMIELAELNPDQISEEHIGFSLAPRLNALGRLSDANAAVELLTTRNLERARILASQLEGLNIERKSLSEQVYQGALAQIKRDPSLLDYGTLVLSHPSWPAGIIGIVANWLVEQYDRPVILIATPPGENGRGSARSVDGCDISEAIAINQNLLESFGGHTMAAGLSIQPERIPDFRRALSRTVTGMMKKAEITPRLQVDGYLSLSELSLDLVRDLERLAPFGPGNPPLTLASRNLKLRSHRVIGRTGEHLHLTVEDENGQSESVIWWQGAENPLPEGYFDLAYVVRANDYRGERRIQLEWIDARPAIDHALEVDLSRRAIEVVDCRQQQPSSAVLDDLKAKYGSLMIWTEGNSSSKNDGVGRHDLDAAETLVVWTCPPGMRELRDALEKVRPQRVILFSAGTGLEKFEDFIKYLSGLVKYGLKHNDGHVLNERIAQATGQRITTVKAGIEWLAAQGAIQIIRQTEDEFVLSTGMKKPGERLSEITTRLNALLKETAAYRAYFRSAEAEYLIDWRLS